MGQVQKLKVIEIDQNKLVTSELSYSELVLILKAGSIW